MDEIRLELHIDEAKEKIGQAIKERMNEAVNEVRNTTLETLSGTRHGLQYFVPGTRRLYTASAPGEAPAQATAQLRRTIKAVVEGEGGQIVGMVGSDLKKAPALEYGTRKMAARPFLRKSFEASADKIKSIFSREWFK